jgi:tetratricopeptide (TPR) repeat protein
MPEENMSVNGMGGGVLALFLAGHAWAVPPAVSEQDRGEAQRAYRDGVELMRAESYPAAVERFQAAIKLDPVLWTAHYGLGQAHMALKEYPDAVRAYLGCRTAFERLADLGMEERAALDKAREDETRELKDSLHRLRSGQLKVSASRITMMEVQLEDRLRFLESSRSLGREHLVQVPAELMLALGSAHYRAGQTAEAEAAYVAAVKADAKLGAAHNNLAVIYMLTGRLEEAAEAVRRAEKAGLKVSPAFKDDLERRRKAAGPPR